MTGAKPLAIDLFCGLGGWTEGLLAEGYNVVGFDIERHDYGTGGYPAQLVLQDALTLHGSQFCNAALIVASPPCQEFSYMAMPWTIAKQKAAHYRANPELIETQLKALFNCCFRIQREACEAAGRHIPMVVENVKGAQRWVGRAAWHFGSFYLWGDVPALMPPTLGLRKSSHIPLCETPVGVGATSWFHGNSKHEGRCYGKASQPKVKEYRLTEATKGNGSWFGNYQEAKAAGRGSANRYTSSKSLARKAASAQIAKIPLPLSRHIASVYYPTAAK